MSHRPWFLAGAPLLLALPLAPPATAAPAGVEQLLQQARYWHAKGREDLARQALQRVLTIDPGNAEARKGLTSGLPAAPSASRPAPASPAAAPRDSGPTRAAPNRAAPARPSPAIAKPAAPRDSSGPARAAGFAALDKGDVAAAESQFQAALKIRPNDADALGGLGLVRLRQSRFADARQMLARASQLGDPGKWQSALAAAEFYGDLGLADAALKANRLGEAEPIARRLAASDYQGHAQAQALLGDILSRQGKFDEAATVYALAASSQGANADSISEYQAKAAQERARQAQAGGNAESAEQFFRQAIVSNPNDPWMRLEYARFLVTRGQMVSAMAAISPLSRSTAPDALYAAALFASQTGRPAEASALMARIPPDRLTAPMQGFIQETRIGEAIARAQQLRAAGRAPDALASLLTLAARPNLPVSALGALAQGLAELGDLPSAAAVAEQALQRPLAEPGAYQGIVAVLVKAGQDAAAAALVQRFLGPGTPSPDAAGLAAVFAANQGDALRLQGQYATAFDVLQQGWASAPGNPELLGSLARLYQSGGMSGQAVQVYEMILAKTPKDSGALMGLADAAAASRDFPRAKWAYDQAIELSPQQPEPYLTAARVEEARGNRHAALEYLKQARAYSVPDTALANGGAFPNANPFTNRPIQAAAPVNPFALASRPARQAQTQPAAIPAYRPAPAATLAIPGPVYLAPPSGTAGLAPVQAGGVPDAPLPPITQQGFAQQAPAQQAAPSPFVRLPASAAPAAADPVAQIDTDIARLANAAGPSLQIATSFRDRSGEEGLSQLNEIGASATLSVPFGEGKLSLTAAPTILDAGTPNRSALARFGTNPLLEANGIVDQINIDTIIPGGSTPQHQSGVALSAGYEHGILKFDVGSTPLGFHKARLQGGASFAPRIAPNITLTLHGERRPVTDSVTSYAGTIDPLSDCMNAPSCGTFLRDGYFHNYLANNPITNASPSCQQEIETLADCHKQVSDNAAVTAQKTAEAAQAANAALAANPTDSALAASAAAATSAATGAATAYAAALAAYNAAANLTGHVNNVVNQLDPGTGLRWGEVMRSGGGASLSYDRNGSGLYLDAAYRHYDGTNVPSNHAVEANIGGYEMLYRTDNTSVVLGANFNYQSYANNQNFFSYGYGGYFSPQSFFSVAFPLRYATRFGRWSINGEGTLGYQSYRQDDVPIFTNSAMQAQLDSLKRADSDVLARYAGISKSGFAFSAGVNGSYRLAPATQLNGDFRYSTFGIYNELLLRLTLTQSIGNSTRP